jgi:hypothetical protein
MSTSPEVLELARQAAQNVEDHKLKCEALQREFQSRVDALSKDADDRNNEIWDQIYDATGLDHNLAYEIDDRYVESDGVVFINKIESETFSLGDILAEALRDV